MESLVSDIPDENGNIANRFLQWIKNGAHVGFRSPLTLMQASVDFPPCGVVGQEGFQCTYFPHPTPPRSSFAHIQRRN
jgi:hypothetical protein